MCDTRPPYLGMPLSQSADQMRLELAPAAKVKISAADDDANTWITELVEPEPLELKAGG